MQEKTLEDVEQRILSGIYDFVDFGCSTGSSLEFGMNILGASKGIGIDIDPNKVKQTTDKGFDAFVFDATKLQDCPNSVSFSLMFHFIEHLPGYNSARTCIKAAITAARDYVFIRQPWFDADGYLASRGLKLYWSDWPGHTFKMTTTDFYRALRDIRSPKVVDAKMYGRRQIKDSSDITIHPITAPAGKAAYSKDDDGFKEAMTFGEPIYAETVCLIRTSSKYSHEQIIGRLSDTQALSNPVLPIHRG